MKLYTTLARKVQDFTPLKTGYVSLYTCGPTVYDHVHIGNLSSFIYADTLRRALVANGYEVKHVMNFTDVDDKTIRRSHERYPDIDHEEALKKLTIEYEEIFLSSTRAIGNDVGAVQFVRATDSIDAMRTLISRLHTQGFAYITDDGVYFSIEKYRASGKIYGQLLELTDANTSNARIDNDEYDKESVHDFALWKLRKDDEPAWEFELEGHNLLGRPGWHIECSVMSVDNLGQPFDIHTGGIDLIFPHHENEIAQSTAGQANPIYAKYFVHNKHLLVEGKKMSKSLNNFFTLRDIQEKGFEPLAFRIMVLQSHYRSQSNFTWKNLEAAQNRLKSLRTIADLRWQPLKEESQKTHYDTYIGELIHAVGDDLNIARALTIISKIADDINETVSIAGKEAFNALLATIDQLLGLDLLSSQNITEEQKIILERRKKARASQNWTQSDELRDQLSEQGIGIKDTDQGQIWFRL